MVDINRCVNLIDILENGKLELNSSALENLFSNIDSNFSILTIINETEKHDFQLFNYILRYFINGGKLDWIYTTSHEELQSSNLTSNKNNSNNKSICSYMLYVFTFTFAFYTYVPFREFSSAPER
jgi:hypothetical protein